MVAKAELADVEHAASSLAGLTFVVELVADLLTRRIYTLRSATAATASTTSSAIASASSSIASLTAAFAPAFAAAPTIGAIAFSIALLTLSSRAPSALTWLLLCVRVLPIGLLLDFGRGLILGVDLQGERIDEVEVAKFSIVTGRLQ